MARHSRRTEIIMLAGFVGLCLAIGFSGSGMTVANLRRWYLMLTPPPGTPPNWLFAPVWTLLYVMMGVAAWLVWRQPVGHPRYQQALSAWGCQLVLNALWTPLFFGLHLLLAALVVILAMLGCIGLTMARFWPVSRPAALLLLPYLLWAGYASYLNAGFWWLNG